MNVPLSFDLGVSQDQAMLGADPFSVLVQNTPTDYSLVVWTADNLDKPSTSLEL